MILEDFVVVDDDDNDGSDDVDGDCYDGPCDYVVSDDCDNGDLAMIVIIHVMVTTMMIMIMIMKVMIE